MNNTNRIFYFYLKPEQHRLLVYLLLSGNFVTRRSVYAISLLTNENHHINRCLVATINILTYTRFLIFKYVPTLVSKQP